MADLVKQSKDSLTTYEPLEWSRRLNKLLLLACQATGKDLMPGEQRLWEACLAGKSIQEIEQGFKAYFSQPKDAVFFPKPGEVLSCIEKRAETRWFEKQCQQTEQEERENRKARESGQCLTWAEIMKEAQTWVREHAIEIHGAGTSTAPREYAPIVVSESRRKKLHEQAQELQKKYSTGNRSR